MKEIVYNNKVVARHIVGEDIQAGLNFFSNDSEFIQVGEWNYDEGKELAAHIHNEVERKVTRTNEVLFVIMGRVKADIYSIDEIFLESVILNSGDILVLLECGHGYHILDNGTKVLEVKNGPYLGADIDRRRF